MRYDISDFGVTDSIETVQTDGLQSVIDRCHEAGGGTVYLPSGTYVTGTLELKSNVSLELEAGAVVRGSDDLSDYPSIGIASENRDTALLVARHATNVSIHGHGTIDGNGNAFFHTDRPAREPGFTVECTRQRESFVAKPNGVEDGPVACKQDEEGNPLRPGTLLLFIDCETVRVFDVSIIGSPNWCLHLAGCRYVSIRGLFVRNSLLIPNADCIDIGNCSYVAISDCYLEAGDDGIAITPCADGYHLAPSENINVNNCTIISRSAAVRVGYGIYPVRNCTFSNLHIYDTNRALGVFIRNGQTIENITFSNITIETRLHTGWWGAGEPIHISAIPGYTEDESLGEIRNVRFINITATSENGVLLYGADHADGKAHIRDILFDNVTIHVKRSALEERFGGNVDLRPTNDPKLGIFEHDLAPVYAKNVDGLVLRNSRFTVHDPMPGYFKTKPRFDTCARVSEI